MTIAEFVDGPFWYFSATVFVVGVVVRLFAMLAQGYKKNYSEPRSSAVAGAEGTNITRFVPPGAICFSWDMAPGKPPGAIGDWKPF